MVRADHDQGGGTAACQPSPETTEDVTREGATQAPLPLRSAACFESSFPLIDLARILPDLARSGRFFSGFASETAFPSGPEA